MIQISNVGPHEPNDQAITYWVDPIVRQNSGQCEIDPGQCERMDLGRCEAQPRKISLKESCAKVKCSRGKKIWIIFLLVTIILIGLGVALYFLFKGQSHEDRPCDESSKLCIIKCQDSQVIKNGKCEDCQFWQRIADGKCISRCPIEKSYDRYNQKCITIQDLFDDSADFLKTKTTTGQLIGSLNNELTCKGESFTTPYSKTPLTLNDYIYVELKTSYVNSGYYYKFKMLMPVKSYLKLAEIVDTNDAQTIQCTSDNTKGCWSNWRYLIDYYYIRDRFNNNGVWRGNYYGQTKDGQVEGFTRGVDSSYTDVIWYTAGEMNGKFLWYKNNKCMKWYYLNGNEKGDWQGNDLSTQYKV